MEKNAKLFREARIAAGLSQAEAAAALHLSSSVCVSRKETGARGTDWRDVLAMRYLAMTKGGVRHED